MEPIESLETPDDVDMQQVSKTRQNYNNFRKLMLLNPLVQPATIHGLLVEFKYDCGLVMEFLFKLHSQKAALYWKKVAELNIQPNTSTLPSRPKSRQTPISSKGTKILKVASKNNKNSTSKSIIKASNIITNSQKSVNKSEGISCEINPQPSTSKAYYSESVDITKNQIACDTISELFPSQMIEMFDKSQYNTSTNLYDISNVILNQTSALFDYPKQVVKNLEILHQQTESAIPSKTVLNLFDDNEKKSSIKHLHPTSFKRENFEENNSENLSTTTGLLGPEISTINYADWYELNH